MRIDGLHRGGALLEIKKLLPLLLLDVLIEIGRRPHDGRSRPPTHIRIEFVSVQLRAVACDIEREALPFNDHSFATIMLCATFEHLRVDPLFALEEMRRVLQPGGLLYLTTPNLYQLGNIASFALGRGLAFDPIREYGKLRTVGHMGHVREYTASEIRRFLERAGFATVGVAMRATQSRRGKLVDAVQLLLPGTRSELVVTAHAAPGATWGV